MSVCKRCGITLIGAEFGEDFCEICQWKQILEQNKINIKSSIAKALKKKIVVWRK